ncbi:hypothetical protein N0V90_009683 [Kalmusia sp. IMI 367209]|nr:hypothetical protein N0V90_009683 [Kalmusia sp. IMI 367209]
MYDDAAYINAVVTKLADEGKEIVLAAHSYGGIPASEALKGLAKAERKQNRKKGGVVHVGYMTALVPAVSCGAGSVMVDAPMDYTSLDEDGWLYHPDPARTATQCFGDVSPEEGTQWCRKFTQHSAASFANELTYAGYKDVPASWLFAEKDGMVLPRMQQSGIDNIERASGRKVDVTRISTDHMPHISAPEQVVDWLVSLVEKAGRE